MQFLRFWTISFADARKIQAKQGVTAAKLTKKHISFKSKISKDFPFKFFFGENPMPQQQNISLIRTLFDEIYTKGNLSLCDQVLATDIRIVDPSAPNFKGGIAAFKEREALIRQAFPDKVVRLDEIFATEDRVIVRWTTQGTHSGPLLDIPASGRNIKISGITIFQLMDGKILEIAQAWDRLGLLEQIGVVEPSTAFH